MKQKFRSGQIVKDTEGNFTPRRISCYIGDGWYYCVQPQKLGGIVTYKFHQSRLRPLNKRERGPDPQAGGEGRAE